jgi:hypothetical protein
MAQLDAFSVDSTGALNVAWVIDGGNWNGPVPISPPNTFPPGAFVAVGKQLDYQLDAFAIDNAGVLRVAWVQNGGDWSGPVPISAGAVNFPPGAPVAVDRQPVEKSVWDTFKDFVNGVVGVITTVGGAITDTLGGILAPFLDPLAGVLGLACSIPYFGTVFCSIKDILLGALGFLLSFGDFLLGLLGILPEKRLRLCIIIQNDERGPVASDEEVLTYLQKAIDVFKGQANVRILPVKPFNYASAFQDTPKASMDYVEMDPSISSSITLDIACDTCTGCFRDQWGLTGASFNWKLIRFCFWGNAQRLVGFGAPIGAFAVRSYTTSDDGCSLSPGETDYVTVNFRAKHPRTLPHELAHACWLPHDPDNDPNNLMNPSGVGVSLSRLQVAILRASRHVTYF